MDKNFNEFIESIKFSNIEKVKSNFNFEYFNKEDRYGLKPIHWACLTSNIEILEWMLEKRCDIETSSRNNWKPIHFARYVRNKEMVERLCQLDYQPDNGETVLDVANDEFNHEFIDEILNENINLKIGLSMGLKCGVHCDHKLCLRSMIQSKFGRNITIEEDKSDAVHNVKDSNSSQKFTVKIVRKSIFDKYPNEKCILPKLNQILISSNHPKIVKWFGIIKPETNIYLFMERMHNGKLNNKIHPNKGFDHGTISQYSKDILQAVDYLHDNKILHRFIHPNNIFIDNNGGCKLAITNYSYSLADGDVQIDDEWLRKYSMFSFVAPELVNKGKLSYPYDIYFVGITVITMLTGKYLHYKLNGCDELEIIISKINNEVLKSFIRSMVMENPNERSTAKNLLNDNFISVDTSANKFK